MRPQLIPPHGGSLVQRWARGKEAASIEAEALSNPGLTLDARRLSDLELLASGAYSPLHGFLSRAEFEWVLHRCRLASGVVWTLPIVLPVDAETAQRFSPGNRVPLRNEAGNVVGILELEESFSWDKFDYVRQVYGTEDPRHPGVRRILDEGDVFLSGPVTVSRRPLPVEFPQYHLDPEETRSLIQAAGWRSVVGFQTRNPIHRAHEFILKSALEIHDGLMIQPLVGETKSGDVPASIRMRCYEVLIDRYFPRNHTLLSVLPAVMRFAGPREAVFHALIRKNYGCTHFIVGRDHAGVGDYYGPYDAQRFFDLFSHEELGITPLRFENTFHCRACHGMASGKTCPHPGDSSELSGSRVREMLSRRESLPVEFTRPEVAELLMEFGSSEAR